MTSVNWTRWSGPAAVVGGAAMLVIVVCKAAGLHAGPFQYLFPSIPLLFLLTVMGLFGLGNPWRFGRTGLFLAFLGAALTMVGLVILLWFNKEPGWGIGFYGLVALSAGLGIFGISAMRNKVLSRWNALPLLIALLFGLPWLFIPDSALGKLVPWAHNAIFALYSGAWMALGYVLWSDSRGLSAVRD